MEGRFTTTGTRPGQRPLREHDRPAGQDLAPGERRHDSGPARPEVDCCARAAPSRSSDINLLGSHVKPIARSVAAFCLACLALACAGANGSHHPSHSRAPGRRLDVRHARVDRAVPSRRQPAGLRGDAGVCGEPAVPVHTARPRHRARRGVGRRDVAGRSQGPRRCELQRLRESRRHGRRRPHLLGTVDARLVCLDRRDGSFCKGFGAQGQVDLVAGLRRKPEWPGEYGVTSPPAVYRDLVIVGSSVADNSRVRMSSGEVRAFDARHGRAPMDVSPAPRERCRPAAPIPGPASP